MPDKKDYYEVMGLQKNATDDDIKRAYRKLAKQYHPDLNPNDSVAEEKFKELNEANQVLSDPEKRRKYDSFGFAGIDPSYGGGGGFGGYGGFGGFDMGGGIDLGDIFDSLFGMGGGTRSANPNAPRQGSDIAASLDISFMEACKGIQREFEISRAETCDVCNGSGAKPGTAAKTCTDCGGSGQVRVQRRTMLGSMQTTSPCSRCSGKGKIVETPCTGCSGQGRVQRRRKVPVNIPAGISEGVTLSVRGEGNAGTNGGGKGDLNIRITVRKDPFFTREGYDIHCDVPLTYSQAALGAEIEVPTIDGSVKLTVPEGTQPETVFRLRGKGVQRLRREGRGDELVKVTIEIPRKLSKPQKDLLAQLEKSMTEKNYEKRTSFFERLRKSFTNN